MTPTKENYMEMDGLIDRCASLGVNNFNLSQFVPTGRGSLELDLKPMQWRKILIEWNIKRKQYENKMTFTAHEAQLVLIEPELLNMRSFSGCQAGRGVACIKPDGAVTPCVMLDITIGDLKRQDFKSIWMKSDDLQKIRNRGNLGSKCRKCHYQWKCGGCRGVAFGITGDYLADDPRCWLSK